MVKSVKWLNGEIEDEDKEGEGIKIKIRTLSSHKCQKVLLIAVVSGLL